MRWEAAILLVVLCWAQDKDKVFYYPRLGLHWAQYHTQQPGLPRSRSYWGGGWTGGIGMQYALAHPTKFSAWTVQGDLGFTQRRSTDRNLLYDWQYTLWSVDIGAMTGWRFTNKYTMNEIFALQAGLLSSILVYGIYRQEDNITGEIARRKVQFGRRTVSDARRGEIALQVGVAAGYLVGPGYLVAGMRFWHGVNNIAGRLFKSWHNYGVYMELSYWYDPARTHE